jgi:hypothetical protein
MTRLWSQSTIPNPKHILTGPLVRGDHTLLNRQLNMLKHRFPTSPLADLYQQWLIFAWDHLYQTPFPFNTKLDFSDGF